MSRRKMQTYTIGDISRKLNVSTDAVRYYDKEGLLPFIKEIVRKKRIYR